MIAPPKEWKVGDRCWVGDGVWSDPRRTRIVFLTETNAVVMDDKSTVPSCLHLGLIARTKAEALAPHKAAILKAAQDEVNRQTWNVRAFTKDLRAAKRKLAVLQAK